MIVRRAGRPSVEDRRADAFITALRASADPAFRAEHPGWSADDRARARRRRLAGNGRRAL